MSFNEYNEANMSMTYEQFVEYALDLKHHSDSIDDGWNICDYQSPMNGRIVNYLINKNMRKVNKSSLDFDSSELNKEEVYTIVCEYHVLYNPSYSCPDMFFNMWHTDGKLLSLEQIWTLVHSYFKPNLIRDKWNAITQEDHPICNKPFFRIHPCRSTHILEILGFSSKNNSELNPLISWLSTISPLVGLEIPLSYGHKKSNIL